jgi:hypothetical protein
MANLPPIRTLQYLQLDFYKMREYCIACEILPRSRRITPFGAGTKNVTPDPGAGQDVSFRAMGQALRTLFEGCEVTKTRNVPEFRILLPEGDWHKDDTDGNIRQDIHPSLATQDMPDNLGRYISRRFTANQRLVLTVAPDGKPDASRWGRRRYETLLRTGRPATNFYEAMRAAVEWKKRMDARIAPAGMRPAEEPAEEPAEQPAEEPENPQRDTSVQAAFEAAAERMKNEREQNAD